MTAHNIRVLLVDDREAVERHIEDLQLPYILRWGVSHAERGNEMWVT